VRLHVYWLREGDTPVYVSVKRALPGANLGDSLGCEEFWQGSLEEYHQGALDAERARKEKKAAQSKKKS
jgi:hypothetical protein